MTRLSEKFWARPFAHRGLHDALRPENSLSAFKAAVEAGYGIELDVQPSSDGEAMVFHDYTLDRLTAERGRTDARTTDALTSVRLGSSDDTIPTLETVLHEIGGRASVLIEVKDQSSGFSQTDGALERRVCEVVQAVGCVKTCAIMSFNPFSCQHVKAFLPEVARGMVSYDFEHPHDAAVDAAHRADLAALRWFDKFDADFVSYGADSFPSAAVAGLRATGIPAFCWTIRSPEQAQRALAHCDQITFEAYHA